MFYDVSWYMVVEICSRYLCLIFDPWFFILDPGSWSLIPELHNKEAIKIKAHSINQTLFFKNPTGQHLWTTCNNIECSILTTWCYMLFLKLHNITSSFIIYGIYDSVTPHQIILRLALCILYCSRIPMKMLQFMVRRYVLMKSNFFSHTPCCINFQENGKMIAFKL